MSFVRETCQSNIKVPNCTIYLSVVPGFFAFRAFERELVYFSIDFLFSIRGSGSGEGGGGGIARTPIPLVPGINKNNISLF